MGDVANRAAHLSHEAERVWQKPIFVGSNPQENTTGRNLSLLTSQYANGPENAYTAIAFEPT